MKYFFIVILGFILLQGCSKQNNDNIIDESKFINVLADIHLADATLAVEGYRVSSDSSKIKLFYNSILIKHNVSQKQIKNTFEYYTKNPRKFEKIYKKVSGKIVKLESEYDESMAKKD